MTRTRAAWARRRVLIALLATAGLACMSLALIALDARSDAPWSYLLIAGITVAATIISMVTVSAAVDYMRVYRNAVVLRATREPEAVATTTLFQMPIVDTALRQAGQREITLGAANIPESRWRRTVEAASSPARAIEILAQAIGAMLGPAGQQAPPNAIIRAATLPPLLLRFAQKSAVAALHGPSCERGDAEALATAVYADGNGPRQAIVLDLTEAQQGRKHLGSTSRVQLLVIDAEALRDLLLAEQPDRELEAIMVAQLLVAELSPYQTTGGVMQESLFFGREAELRTMADRSLRSFIVVAARQMGKSTLLRALERRFAARGDVEVSYLELAGSDIMTPMAARRRERAGDAARPDGGGGVASEDGAAPSFAELAAGTTARPRLWLIDEADKLIAADAGAGYPISAAMRTLGQEGRACFVLAGFWELYAATVFDYQHPLLNFAERVRLGPLDRDAARALATTPITALGLSWDCGDTVDRLVDGAGCRANLIVLACKGIIATLPASERVLTRTRLEDVVAQDVDLRDALDVLRRVQCSLQRAIVHQALLMEERDGRAAGTAEIRAALRGLGLDAQVSEYEQAFASLELGYVLIEARGGGRVCPVPWVRQRLLGGSRPADLVAEHIEDWQASRRAAPA